MTKDNQSEMDNPNSLRESEGKYRTILENMQEGYFEVDLAGNLTFFNDSMCQIWGYPKDELMGMNNLQLTDKEDARRLYKTFNEVYKTGEPAKEFDWQIIRKDGVKKYIETSISLRKNSSDQPIGFRGIIRDITESKRSNEALQKAHDELEYQVKLRTAELAKANEVLQADIVARKQMEEELQTTLSSLRKAVSTTIQVLVAAIEARDPYTAGHQKRVADLACAIAKEMGHPPEMVEGIRMAGCIHDIGKLSLPAEILSKPTKLTALEFALIKEHSQSGYEILKDVESPWQLAEMVYQHHERMDGSGYPRKLQGKDIIIEARILAVADVVEAMASDRPYRPSLGIDPALAEIEKNRGIFYDDAVVAAGLRLFREKGFKLENT